MTDEQSHLLSPADSGWLALERPDNPMMITVMLRVEGLTESRFREFLRVYWMSWERFRYMPVRRMRAWWWQPDPVFDPDHHLQVVPGVLSPEQLQDWVSARLNQPLPAWRPRWKFWLVPEAEGGAALLLRIHHCYADGLSLLGIFDRLCPPSPGQHPVLYGCPATSDSPRWLAAARLWLDRWAAAGGEAPENMADDAVDSPAGGLVDGARNSLKLIHEVTGFMAEPEDTPSDLRRPLLGRRQCRWSQPLALDRFRAVAKATGVTINDVLLSCVAAAVRPRLGLDAPELEEAVLHAAVPVDIRSRLPEELKPEPGALGNCFGTVFVPLPVDGNSPLERLYRIKQETRRLKKGWQPGIAWGLASCAALIPENWRQPVADIFYRKASAVVSNVPGTREPRYLAGCPIREQMFWVPQAGDMGLGISIVSYAGQVQFGVVADEAVLSDPGAFLGDCVRELEAFPAGS